MTRPLAITALLGLAAALTAYVVNPAGRQKLAVGNGLDNGIAGAAITMVIAGALQQRATIADSALNARQDPAEAASKSPNARWQF